MIKLIKIGDLIYQGFEEKIFDEKGNAIWNIPTDVEEFRKITIDTINWYVGDAVKKQIGDFAKLSAANSKAIVLLTKLLVTLSPDDSKLSDLEKSAWDKLTAFADNGYADSKLLNNSLSAVSDYVVKGGELISKALQATTLDELIGILNEVFRNNITTTKIT